MSKKLGLPALRGVISKSKAQLREESGLQTNSNTPRGDGQNMLSNVLRNNLPGDVRGQPDKKLVGENNPPPFEYGGDSADSI